MTAPAVNPTAVASGRRGAKKPPRPQPAPLTGARRTPPWKPPRWPPPRWPPWAPFPILTDVWVSGQPHAVKTCGEPARRILVRVARSDASVASSGVNFPSSWSPGQRWLDGVAVDTRFGRLAARVVTSAHLQHHRDKQQGHYTTTATTRASRQAPRKTPRSLAPARRAKIPGRAAPSIL